MLNVFDEMTDGQTTVSRHEKPLAITFSQEWFYKITTTTEFLQNNEKRDIFRLGHTLVRLDDATHGGQP